MPIEKHKDIVFSWAKFRDSGLLFWFNRILHTFNLTLVFNWENRLADGEPDEVYLIQGENAMHEEEMQYLRKVQKYFKENT